MDEFRAQDATAYTTNTAKIVRNRCQCTACLDIIESKHRHDFVSCKCGRIFTDGGQDYIRRGFVNTTDILSLDEFENCPTETLDK